MKQNENAKRRFTFFDKIFQIVKADIFGTRDQVEENAEFDIEEGPTEATHLMRAESEDVTEHEISNSDFDHGQSSRTISNNDSVVGGQHQMHRPTMQVKIVG